MLRANDMIGPYTLVRQLGRGAFGVVWLAERRGALATTEVALKLALDEEPDLPTIQQEAQLWARVGRHPNIVPIIEADIYDNQVVIVSEFVPDGALDGWLKQHGGKAPSLAAALSMTIGILAGLEHLHSKKIIHRDLKPANILLQGEIPRLADFGIARVLKSSAATANVAGTPAFMSPEAFNGERSEQSDIWSVGVIIYLMLSGRVPFPQKDLISLMGAIATREHEPLPASVPKPLQQIIDKTLHKDLKIRYRSAAELRREIERFLTNLTNATNAANGTEKDPRQDSQKDSISPDDTDKNLTKADTEATSKRSTEKQAADADTKGNRDRVKQQLIDTIARAKDVDRAADNDLNAVEKDNRADKEFIQDRWRRNLNNLKKDDAQKVEAKIENIKIERPPVVDVAPGEKKPPVTNVAAKNDAPDLEKQIGGFIVLLILLAYPAKYVYDYFTRVKPAAVDTSIRTPVQRQLPSTSSDPSVPPPTTIGPYKPTSPVGEYGATNTSNDYVYEDFSGGVVMPIFYAQPTPNYTPEARQNNIHGVVNLSVVFRKDGRVTDIKVVRGLGYGLDEEAIKAVSQYKYLAGTKNNLPINVHTNVEVGF